MTGLLPDRPLIVLREERGGPPKVRVDRIRAYMRQRQTRRLRDARREKAWRDAEERRHVPCALCGGRTAPWDRYGLPNDLVICGNHGRGMCGYFPFRRGVLPTDMPDEVNRLLMSARYALFAFERLTRTMEGLHGRHSG